jgi:hypothetical protein
VAAVVVVVVDEGGDGGLEFAFEEVVFRRMRFLRVWCRRSILPYV